MRHDARRDVATWIAQGRLDAARARDALVATGAVPTPEQWRQFLERTLASLACVAIAAALGFFVAANWQALGRFGKLALVEGAIVVALAVVAWRGLDTPWGRGALLFASLAVGTLLAFVGQTYQTGADGYELFLAWALALLPWALVARMPAVWLIVVALIDVAAWLYAGLAVQWWGIVFGLRGATWLILAIHVVALVVWEIALARGLRCLDASYAVRLLAIGAGAAATALVVEAIALGNRGGSFALAAIAYVALMAALYRAYRVRRVDLFILAVGVLSTIVVVVTLLVDAGVLKGFGGFLGTGLVIVLLAGAGAHWLRGVARGRAT
jgi:uncharacterized membrane protein